MKDWADEDWEEFVESLPVPGKDKRPPAIGLPLQAQQMAREEARFKSSLLDPKVDTEKRVKTALHSLLGMNLRKDGDYNVGGFWTKKIADFVGSTPANNRNWHTYVEVKGISPGNNFNLSRLDRPNKEGEPSQHEKLTKVYEEGNFVLLALGWWYAPPRAEPIMVRQKSRQVKRWRKKELDLGIDLVPWEDWLMIYNTMDRRSLRSRDRHLFADCRIYKEDNRWHLVYNHWWYDLVEICNPRYGSILTTFRSNG